MVQRIVSSKELTIGRLGSGESRPLCKLRLSKFNLTKRQRNSLDEAAQSIALAIAFVCFNSIGVAQQGITRCSEALSFTLRRRKLNLLFLFRSAVT